MSYATVTVIVEGALSDEREFEESDETRGMDAFIDSVASDAADDGLETEVYILWHEHEPLGVCPACGPTDDPNCFIECVCACHDGVYDECQCAQYVTSHHPAYSWNVEES